MPKIRDPIHSINGQPVKTAAEILKDAPKDRISEDLRKLPLVSLDQLILDPMNARLHPERNLQAIKLSLAMYGQRSNLTVNRRTMHIEKGNGTFRAAKELGWTVLACSFEDDDQVTAAGYGLADNRTAELAQWDAAVVQMIEQLQADAKVPMVGWSDKDIQIIRQADWKETNSGGQGGSGLSGVDTGPVSNIEDLVCPECGCVFPRKVE